MELNTEQVKKGLKCCTFKPKCKECPYNGKDCFALDKDAHAIIESQEQKIFELENRLKECENGYEGTLHLERAKIKELTDRIEILEMLCKVNDRVGEDYIRECNKNKELTEQNEKLKAELLRIVEKDIPALCVKEMMNTHTAAIAKHAYAIAVQNMAERVKSIFNPDSSYDIFQQIDQIAKEELERVCGTTN